MPINFGLLNTNAPEQIGSSIDDAKRNRLATLAAEQGQQLQALQLQSAKQSAADDTAIRNAMKQYGGDISQALPSIMQTNPRQGLEYQKLLDQQAQEKLKRAQEETKLIKSMASQGMANPTLENSAALLQQYQQQTGKAHPEEFDALRATNGDPELIKRYWAGHGMEADKMVAKFETIPLGGSTLKNQIDPISGKVLASQTYWHTPTPADKAKPFYTDESGKLQANIPVQQYEMSKSKAGASNVKTVVNPAIDPFKNEKALREEYQGLPQVKSAAEMNTAFKMIETAYQRPSAANDLAMATKFMKILDPTSVVRESEFAMAVNATGLMDKVYNYANMIKTGQKLNPSQRKDFYDSAKAINEAFQGEAQHVGERYKGIAGQYGLDPGNITFGTDFAKRKQPNSRPSLNDIFGK